MSFGSSRRLRSSIAVIAALVLVGSAGMRAGQGADLIANPVLTRELPPPGWLSTHRDEWVRDHAAYRATCRNAQVGEEIHLVNRAIAYDEYLLSLVSKTGERDPAVANQAKLARESMPGLRADIVAADRLVTQLEALPACTEAAATMPPPPAAEPPPAAGPVATALPPSPPPAPPPSGAPEPGDPDAPTAQPAAAAPPAPSAPQRLVISFDERVAALTPSGIRVFREALEVLRSGRHVELAIGGCDTVSDFSFGSPCARRLLSLKALLAENGIRDPSVIAAPAAARSAATPPSAAPEPPPVVAEPQPVATAPAPPATPEPSKADSASAPPAAATPAPSAPQRLEIGFDDRFAALTPAGIRRFREVLDALRSGKNIQLAIGGCAAGADFSNGSPCARRLASLEALLAENGVRDPKRLFAGLR